MKLATLHKRLQTANLTRLAAASGVSIRTIRRLKNEGANVTLTTIAALSAALTKGIK